MEERPVILVVDDDPGTLKVVSIELELQDFVVVQASSAAAALAAANERRPDVAVVDRVMPGVDGMHLMAELKNTYGTPVILLTAISSDLQKVKALDLGADDYLTKPFNPEELTARIQAILRRTYSGSSPQPILTHAGINIDLERRVVTRDGSLVQFTRQEWLILEALSRQAGQWVPFAHLLGVLSTPESSVGVAPLRVWIWRLRKKIESDPANPTLIVTKPGFGYKLTAEPAP